MRKGLFYFSFYAVHMTFRESHFKTFLRCFCLFFLWDRRPN